MRGAALRHGSTGPTPISMTITSSMGPLTRSKKGLPTVTTVSLAASEKIGKIVPQSVTNATVRNSTFWARKALSRDSIDSRRPLLLSVSDFQMNSAVEAISVTAMNIRNSQPIDDCANEWTDGTGPPRLMNMPSWAMVKATMIIIMFHILNMPRRFWTMIECTNAVIASQGMRAEFSTGSQAQYPPQPSMV